MKEAIAVGASIIVSLGGAGVIVVALSSWLGKIWANRIMVSDRARHNEALEQLRARLLHENETKITEIKNELEIYKEKHLTGHTDKIVIYRLATDIIVEFLGDLAQIAVSGQVPEDAGKRVERFNRGRMKAYGYLGMLAPQGVMDAYDSLVDHLWEITEGRKEYTWPEIRILVLGLLNVIREDIGFDSRPIEYKGRR